MNLTAVLFALVVASEPAPAPTPIAGDWSGAIEIPGSPLGITLHLDDSAAPTASLDIPAQQLKRQPLKDVVVDAKTGKVSATFAEAGAVFAGVVVVDSFSG
jgi:hypothetical protein